MRVYAHVCMHVPYICVYICTCCMKAPTPSPTPRYTSTMLTWIEFHLQISSEYLTFWVSCEHCDVMSLDIS